MNRTLIALDEIYLKHYDAIERYLARLVSPEEAADLTQEVFTKVARNLPRFEGRSKIATWIFRIATNTAFDRLRAMQRGDRSTPFEDTADMPADLQAADSAVSSENPLECVINTEMNACIHEHVDKLPDIYRTVLILSAFEELQNKDIAEILDISQESVKIRLHRARAQLRKILQNACRFYHNPETGALSCDRKR